MKLIPLFIYAASPVQYFDDGSFEAGGIPRARLHGKSGFRGLRRNHLGRRAPGRFPERGITGDISRGCTYAGAAAIREVISPASPATTALKLFWPISACPHRGRPFQRRSV